MKTPKRRPKKQSKPGKQRKSRRKRTASPSSDKWPGISPERQEELASVVTRDPTYLETEHNRKALEQLVNKFYGGDDKKRARGAKRIKRNIADAKKKGTWRVNKRLPRNDEERLFCSELARAKTQAHMSAIDEITQDAGRGKIRFSLKKGVVYVDGEKKEPPLASSHVELIRWCLRRKKAGGDTFWFFDVDKDVRSTHYRLIDMFQHR